MYVQHLMPYRRSRLSLKGYLMIALICLLIASTIGS